jgi:hypothetical protein
MLDSLMENEWILTDVGNVLTDALDRYYLIYWEPKYLTKQIVDGRLIHQGISYQVIYTDRCKPHNCESGKYKQVALSFRAAKPEYGIYPKVLIRGIPV